MQLSDCLLLADIEDVLKTVLPVIFFILYGIAQLIGGKREANRRPAAPRPRPLPPPEGAGPAPGQAGGQPNQEQSLRLEVEEFLRRAQGKPPAKPAKRNAGARPEPAGSGRRPERVAPQRPAPQRPEAPTRRLTPASTPISPMGSPGASSPPPLGSGVAQHVAEHLGGAAAIVQHAQQLGADVARADDRLEQHLKDKFAHQVGNLAPQATSAQRRTEAASSMAAEYIKLLSRPEGVRQAFIASEIFRQPVERWD